LRLLTAIGYLREPDHRYLAGVPVLTERDRPLVEANLKLSRDGTARSQAPVRGHTSRQSGRHRRLQSGSSNAQPGRFCQDDRDSGCKQGQLRPHHPAVQHHLLHGTIDLERALSFAQFEREVAGERIRDKIAASKRKGMWMGGTVPLGYDSQDRKLIVNPAEAATVRKIYGLYLELGCVSKLKLQLGKREIRSKIRVSKAGRKSGGFSYSRGALYELLKNRVYLGEITHRGSSYPGQHEGIISKDVWDKVQAQLTNNNDARRHGVKARHPSLLAGLIHDEHGNRFTPSHSVKDGTSASWHRFLIFPDLTRGPTGHPLHLILLDTSGSKMQNTGYLSLLQGQRLARSRTFSTLIILPFSRLPA
jgi:hypothetical protein